MESNPLTKITKDNEVPSQKLVDDTTDASKKKKKPKKKQSTTVEQVAVVPTSPPIVDASPTEPVVDTPEVTKPAVEEVVNPAPARILRLVPRLVKAFVSLESARTAAFDPKLSQNKLLNTLKSLLDTVERDQAKTWGPAPFFELPYCSMWKAAIFKLHQAVSRLPNILQLVDGAVQDSTLDIADHPSNALKTNATECTTLLKGLYHNSPQSTSFTDLSKDGTFPSWMDIALVSDGKHADGHVPVDLEMLLLAVRSRGRFDPYLEALTYTALSNKASTVSSAMAAAIYPPAIFPADPNCRAAAKHAERILEFCNSLQVDNVKYERYVKSLVSADVDVVLDTLRDLERDLWHAQMSRHPASIRHIERLLICLLGHPKQEIREQAVMLLNSFYDGTDWQLQEPFTPIWRHVGDDFVVEEELEIDDCSGVFVLLHAPSYHTASTSYTLSWHKPDIVKVSGSKQNSSSNNNSNVNAPFSEPNIFKVSCRLAPFPRAGFYDWRLVKAQPDGSWGVVARPKPLAAGAETDPAAYGILPIQGRFIVQPRGVRNELMHEVVVDLESAKWDKSTGVFLERGSFHRVQESLSNYKDIGITSLYLMGALERDNGPTYYSPDTQKYEYLRAEASPLAVIDRATPNAMLGGAKAFESLMKEAKRTGIKIMIDSLTRVSASRAHRKYRDVLVHTLDESGRKVFHFGTDGKTLKWDDTALLNYRKIEAWDLLLDDIKYIGKKYNINGIHLDNAQSWPEIMVPNMDELLRKDPDGQPAYSAQQVLEGEVVIANEDGGFWHTRSAERYSNPMLIKLCKELWSEFPDFMIVGGAWSESGEEGREAVLARSGVIPHVSTLPVALSTLFGKELHKDGRVTLTNRQTVVTLKKWFDETHKGLPEGAYLVQGSINHSSPYPALLYGRGAWPATDLLFFLPDTPMTFIGELEGKSYRIDLANVYEHRDVPNASLQPIPRPQSLLGLQQLTGPLNGSAGPLNTPAPVMHKVRSLNSLEDIRSVDQLEEKHHKEVGPEFGFNLKLIKGHYAHRMSLRSQKEVLRIGEMIPLLARHPTGWHQHVLAFCRYTPEESAIFAINFNDHAVTCYIDMTELASKFDFGGQGDTFIYIVSNWFDPESSPEYFSLEELLYEQHMVTLQPFSSMCWGVLRSSRSAQDGGGYSLVYHRSLVRLYKKIQSTQDTLHNFIMTQIVKSLGVDGSLDVFANVIGRLYSRYLTNPMIQSEIPLALHDILCSTETLRDGDLSARLVAFVKVLAKSDASSPPVTAAREIASNNNLGPIVFIAPELGRFSTVGGLGVMVNELTEGLVELGQDVWVISPYYEKNNKGDSGYLARDEAKIEWKVNLEVSIGGARHTVGVHEGDVNGVRCFFLHNSEFFPKPYPDGNATFMVKMLSIMAKGSLELLCYMRVLPAIVLTNDWFTGLVPGYAKCGAFGQVFQGTTFFHIVHNLEPTYEGRLYPEPREGSLEHIHELPAHCLVDPYWQRLVLNPSRCALLMSDTWGTVSPSYKGDLLSTSPLAAILKRVRQPFAYPNGIPVQQRINRLRQKAGADHDEAKGRLQVKYFGFQAPDLTLPLFSFVGRITQQKGVHLILDAVEGLIHRFGGRIQILLGGMVNKTDPYSARCGARMDEYRRRFPNNFWAGPNEFFTDGPLVNLGSDFGLMPSLFEPGGIVQHEFFVGGTPVIAFKTGGLKDSVFEFDPERNSGCGFTFEAHTVGDLVFAVERAMRVFNDPDKYKILRENAFKAVIDCSEVARAWLKEFFRLRKKIYADPVVVERLESFLPSWDASSYNEDNSDVTTVAPTRKESDSAKAAPVARKQSAQFERRVPTLFKYRPTGARPKAVLLTGSFDAWATRRPLKWDNSIGAYLLEVAIPPGKYSFKFVVDGNWVLGPGQATELDNAGNLNNVIVVQ
eukprot:GILJ01005578.1.p1 GENE.GILJ01005578.1~~GILJ01005578.1.p1  ORF type:complete len:1904 (+),score=304.73 GILJ01005578.1:50-5761(+)